MLCGGGVRLRVVVKMLFRIESKRHDVKSDNRPIINCKPNSHFKPFNAKHRIVNSWRRVFDLDFYFLVADGFWVRRGNLDDTSVAGDLLNGAHENICNDRYPEEAPQHSNQVEESPHLERPRVLADERQKKTFP